MYRAANRRISGSRACVMPALGVESPRRPDVTRGAKVGPQSGKSSAANAPHRARRPHPSLLERDRVSDLLRGKASVGWATPWSQRRGCGRRSGSCTGQGCQRLWLPRLGRLGEGARLAIDYLACCLAERPRSGELRTSGLSGCPVGSRLAVCRSTVRSRHVVALVPTRLSSWWGSRLGDLHDGELARRYLGVLRANRTPPVAILSRIAP